MTLKAGTIIATGTPAGVGMGMDPPQFLKPGDVVRCEDVYKRQAPTILVVLADANARCGVQDGSLVMGNLMNAAAAIGLGSCWINRCLLYTSVYGMILDTESSRAMGRERKVRKSLCQV